MPWDYKVQQSLLDKIEALRLSKESKRLILDKINAVSRLESPLSQGGRMPCGWGYRVASNVLLIARIDADLKLCIFTTVMIY
jgi:hypothetical protein